MRALRYLPRLSITLTALVIGLMTAMLYQAEERRVDSERWVDHTQEVLNDVSAMSESMSRIGVAQLGFLLTGKHAFLAERDRRMEQLRSETERVAFLTADNPDQQRRIRQLTAMIDDRHAAMRQAEAVRRARGAAEENLVMEGYERTDAILKLIAEMKAEEMHLLQLRNQRAAVLYRNERAAMSGIALACALLILAGYFYSRRQKRARKAVEHRLETMADNLPGALYQARIDRSLRETPLFLSSGADALLQLGPSSAIQRNALTEAMEEADRSGYLAAIAQASREHGVFRHEYRLHRSDGSVIWVHHEASVTPQPDGSLLLNGYFYDISEQVRMKEALNEAKDAAERADRAKGIFLATMSHEIRTPMNGVIGMLELLGQTNLDDEQRSMLRIVRDSNESLLRLLNDILDFSKIEAGKVELRPQAVSIGRKIEDLCQLNAVYAASKGLVLKTRVDPNISPVLLVDRMLLRQILNNFIVNAIKFTPSGSVTLAAELVSRENAVETVCFSVSDTGIGIAPEEQARLFEPFSRSDEAMKRSVSGTGLGLSICKRLAGLMGGTIDLISAPGEGTTISLSLPLPVVWPETPEDGAMQSDTHSPVAAPTPEERAYAQRADSASPPVLVVDDQPVNRIVLMRQLRELGHASECAEGGEAAFAKWQTGQFSLIVTDCSMPGMDGYALARAIRAAERGMARSRIPILASTANASADVVHACFAAGMDDCLVKPLTLQRLREALHPWLQAAALDRHGVDEEGQARTHAHADASVDLPIDSSVLADLTGGDADIKAQLFASLRASTRQDAEAIERAVAMEDMATLATRAHRMLGACMVVGARSLAARCRELMQSGQSCDKAAMHVALPRFHEERARLDDFLDRMENDQA